MTNEQAQALLRGPQSPLFAVPQEHLQQMAGDVVPLPIRPGPMAGPAGSAMVQAERARRGDPNSNVVLQPPERYQMWLENLKARYGVR